MNDARPLKRQRGLNVEKFSSELLVYDTDAHQAHSLNATAASVWHECDGRSSAADIAERLTARGVPGFTEELVLETFDELARVHLLEGETERVADPSRRSALVKLGWAAGIPLVTSIAVPKPAFAQTVGPNASTRSQKKTTDRGGSSGSVR